MAIQTTISLVGMRSNLSEEAYPDFIAHVAGRMLVLLPEPTNAFDPWAIAVWDNGQVVGHVRNTSLPVAWGALMQSSDMAIMVRAIEFHHEGSKEWLIAEIETEEPIIPYEKGVSLEDYNNWQCDVTPLPRAHGEALLEYSLKALKISLQGNMPCQQLKGWCQQIEENMCVGFSREVFALRHEVHKLLKVSKDADANALCEVICQSSYEAHTDEGFTRGLLKWEEELRNSEEAKSQAAELTAEERARLTSQLKQFPIPVVKKNNLALAKTIYYGMIPQAVLQRMMSARVMLALSTKFESVAEESDEEQLAGKVRTRIMKELLRKLGLDESNTDRSKLAEVISLTTGQSKKSIYKDMMEGIVLRDRYHGDDVKRMNKASQDLGLGIRLKTEE